MFNALNHLEHAVAVNHYSKFANAIFTFMLASIPAFKKHTIRTASILVGFSPPSLEFYHLIYMVHDIIGMSEVSLPSFQDFMLPALKFLGNGGVKSSHSSAQIREYIKNTYPITEAQANAKFQSGVKKFSNRVSWALVHLQGAKFVIGKDRKYSITPSGNSVLKQNLDRIDVKYLKTIPAYQEWLETFRQSDTPSDSDQDTPEAVIENEYTKIKKSVMDGLYSKIMERDSKFFEKLAVELVMKMLDGKEVIEPKEGSDKGIDGIVLQDIFGIEEVPLQSKRWNQGTISNKDILAFAGAIGARNAKKGVFVTTSTFTTAAINAASSINTCKIILIDKDKLLEYMYDYNVGVRHDDRPIELKSIDENYFTDD